MNVCLVALNAYPAINPVAGGVVGGTETRAWLFARMLARRQDLAVSLTVRHTAPLERDIESRVRLIAQIDRLYRMRESVGHCAVRTRGFPFVKVIRWQPRLLWQIPVLAAARLFESRPTDPRQPSRFFREIAADAFCCFGTQSTAATAIASAHASGRPAALFLGSDDDLNESNRADSPSLNPYGDSGAICHFALINADLVIAQTRWQQQMLQQRFGRSSIVIGNPIDLQEWDALTAAGPGSTPIAFNPQHLANPLDRYVLWVGRAEKVHKRPQLCVELARQCPEVKFLMLLNPRDPLVAAEITATAPPNVRIVSQVPFTAMPGLFRQAAAYVNTSALEGFPNLFLQAAASRVPTGSLVVGEEFLHASHAGVYCGGQMQQLAEFVRSMWNNPTAAQQLGSAGRAYVEQHHAPGPLSDQLANALLTLRHQ